MDKAEREAQTCRVCGGEIVRGANPDCLAAMHDDLAAAEAKIERLREALAKIDTLPVDWKVGPAENLERAAKVARAALEASEEVMHSEMG